MCLATLPVHLLTEEPFILFSHIHSCGYEKLFCSLRATVGFSWYIHSCLLYSLSMVVPNTTQL